MVRIQQSRSLQLAIAITAPIVALGLTMFLYPVTQRIPFLFFFAALAASAGFGGLWSGIVTSILSVILVDYFVIPPLYTFAITEQDIVVFSLFIFVALIISVVYEARRRAELLAAQEREQLRITLTSIGDAVIATDAQGHVTFMNKVAESLTGWSADMAEGKGIDDVFRIVNEQTRQAVENPVMRTLREGTVVGLANHTLLMAKDGNEYVIDDSGAPIRNADGKITGAVLVFRDVTRQKALQDAQAQLAAIVASTTEAIISETLDGTITSWNKAAEQLFGYPAEEAIGKPVTLIAPAERQNESQGLVERIKHGEAIERFETQRTRKDGTRLDVALTLSPIYDADGSLTGIAKIFRDITKARQQAAAQEFLARASEAFGSSIDFETTLKNVARMAVPAIADWCAIDLLDDAGALREVEVIGTDPVKVEAVKKLRATYTPDDPRPNPPRIVAQTGKTFLIPKITWEDVESSGSAPDPETAELLRNIDMHALLYVPLKSSRRMLGVISLTTNESKRDFGPEEVALAEELARRASIAIENSLLYREAQAQREQLRVTLTSIGDAVIATDSHGTITFMNAIAETLTGWKQAEAAGKPLTEVFHIVNERTRQPVESPVDKVLRSGSIVGLANHTVLISRDGREIPIDDSGAPIYTQDRDIVGVILVFRDITERYQIEAERTVANERLAFLTQVSTTLVSSIEYEATLANLAQLLVPKLADNCVIDLVTSDGSLQRLAVASTDPVREEALRELARRFPPDPKASSTRQSVIQRKPRLVPELTDAYYQAAAQSQEHFELMKASGGKSLLIVPLFIGDRSIGGISLGLVESDRQYDESDLQLMEEIAHRASFAVEHARLYREAQQEIHRREQAERALQDAVADRDEFLSVAAHELKTPVTSLRGFAQTLLRQLDKRGSLDMAQVENALHIIDQQSIKLTTLIAQLLDVSRLEAGRLVLEWTTTDLPALIAGVIANIQRGTDYPISLQAPDSLPVEVDPLRLEQVLINLIENAIKYSPHREPIQLNISMPAPDVVQVSVRDHGVGIPPERRQHLFERFYQAHRDGYQGGMGLGLYISQQIVQLHGGTIHAEFPEPQGSEFIVRLPLNSHTGPEKTE